MIVSFEFEARRPMRCALRVGVIYNYNTNSETSLIPKDFWRSIGQLRFSGAGPTAALPASPGSEA
jgi:hypothetical protein